MWRLRAIDHLHHRRRSVIIRRRQSVSLGSREISRERRKPLLSYETLPVRRQFLRERQISRVEVLDLLGVRSCVLRKIEENENGFQTRTGRRFCAQTVKNIALRMPLGSFDRINVSSGVRRQRLHD
jgi:hypothetical protein